MLRQLRCGALVCLFLCLPGVVQAWPGRGDGAAGLGHDGIAGPDGNRDDGRRHEPAPRVERTPEPPVPHVERPPDPPPVPRVEHRPDPSPPHRYDRRDDRPRHHYDHDHWRRGRWYHGHHGERQGWWWIVGPTWFWYSAPVYPYPAWEEVEPAPENPPLTTDPTGQYWYYCLDPPGYHPYVPSCYGPWQMVPITP